MIGTRLKVSLLKRSSQCSVLAYPHKFGSFSIRSLCSRATKIIVDYGLTSAITPVIKCACLFWWPRSRASIFIVWVNFSYLACYLRFMIFWVWTYLIIWSTYLFRTIFWSLHLLFGPVHPWVFFSHMKRMWIGWIGCVFTIIVFWSGCVFFWFIIVLIRFIVLVFLICVWTRRLSFIDCWIFTPTQWRDVLVRRVFSLSFLVTLIGSLFRVWWCCRFWSAIDVFYFVPQFICWAILLSDHYQRISSVFLLAIPQAIYTSSFNS